MEEVDWNEFGDVKQDTGYSPYILSYVWRKYGGETTPIQNPKDLYRIYTYIHRYPRWRQCKRDLEYSKWCVSKKLMPHMTYLASVMDEIHWEDRLSPYNHTPHFPKYVTGTFISIQF